MRDNYKTVIYEKLSENSDNQTIIKKINDLQTWAVSATRAREIDLQDYNNQVSSNIKFYDYVPTSSSDLIGTEQAGDIAADTSYIYIVVDNSGTLQWQRVATSTF